MGEREITQFLTHLAVQKHVAASTQNQAFAALLFLYQQVLNESLISSITSSGLAVRRSFPWRLHPLKRVRFSRISREITA